MFFHK